jgi:6-phosphogluconate dehydrogenase
VGPSGTGHYVKMIHNGIEYGILQAYAEGFHLLKEGSYKDQLDLAAIANLWNHGSIIRSFILQLAHQVLQKDQNFTTVHGSIQELGTGQWTLKEAQESHIETPVLAQSLQVRAWSRATGGNYATKLIALLRNAFGGHLIKKRE